MDVRACVNNSPTPPDPTNPPATQFASVEAAVHACILLHNQDVDGNVLYVTFSDASPGL